MTGAHSPLPLLASELRLQLRHGILPALAVTAVLWAVVLLALPRDWRPLVLPWLLFLEVGAVGFFFLPALEVVERGNGVTAALRLTRLHPATALTLRVGVLVLGATAVSLLLATVSGVQRPGPVLTGSALTTILFSLVALVTIGRAEDLTVLLARAPLVAIPLIVPALVDRAGLLSTPWFLLSPATGAFRLLAGVGSLPGVAVLVLWCAVLWVAAVRIGFDVEPARTIPRSSRRHGALAELSAPGRWGAVRSFAVVDRSTLLSNRTLLLLLAGIPLIAAALGWTTGPGIVWFRGRYGLELGPHLPALWAFVLVLHIPVMIGAITGLLFLEDRDAGLFPVIAATPASLVTLVGYRLAATVGVAGVAVGGALLMTGAVHPAGGVGVVATGVAAGAVATVPAVLMATLAHDRVQGMALLKVVTLPLYLPVAWWFVDGPLGWLFAAAPTAWAARALWADSAVASIAFAGGAAVISLAVCAILLPRLTRASAVA